MTPVALFKRTQRLRPASWNPPPIHRRVPCKRCAILLLGFSLPVGTSIGRLPPSVVMRNPRRDSSRSHSWACSAPLGWPRRLFRSQVRFGVPSFQGGLCLLNRFFGASHGLVEIRRPRFDNPLFQCKGLG